MKVLIICEGESEELFLNELKSQGKLASNITSAKIIIFKSWTRTRNIKTIHKGYDEYWLIHDTDNINEVSKFIDFFKENIGRVILNDPNFDFFCGEYLNLKWNKDDKKDVLRKINGVVKSKRGKKLNYNIFIEKGALKNIKNKANYEIISLIDFNI